MIINIYHSGSYSNERKYVYDVVFKEWLGISYKEFLHDKAYTIIKLGNESKNEELLIQEELFSTPKQKWLTKESLPKTHFSCLDLSHTPFKNLLYDVKLPLIYSRSDGSININKTKIEINFDLFGSIFFMLTRYEEVVKESYDSHERFSSKSSVCYDKYLKRPLVNEYLELLWNCLIYLWPYLKRKDRFYRLFLTHDVDHPLFFKNKPYSSILKTTMGDLLRKDPIIFSKRIGSFFLSKFWNDIYDINNTFNFIMDESEKANVKSAFYFIAGHTAGSIDGYYNLDMPFIRQLMKHIHVRGHEIGLHPSYNTFLSKKNLQKEFENLKRVAEIEKIKQENWGGRQHYLRWRAPYTWQNWEDVGLSYDSTLTYADHVGFRCGTCYDFPVFNLLTSSSLKLREIPLIVMEGSLLNYQKQNLLQAYESIKNLSNTVRFFNGTFSLLWHNDGLISSSTKNIYRDILSVIY